MPGTLPAKAKDVEKVEMCKAVKCSFLESSCSWTLGPSWKRADGNIAMEVAGEDVVVSALFKSPLGSYLEFDLWMSDDSFFTVFEIMDGIDVMLFTRQGMSNNGWHRFRIPLRPSFSPVQIKFKNSLPPGGFITLSNTRLVNGNGEEVSCETVEGNSPGFAIPSMLAAPKPMNLAPNPSIFAPLPIMSPRPSMPLKEHATDETSSFGGNIFEGLKPIEPMKEDPFRLTAFQGYNPKMLIPTTTPDPFPKLLPSPEFDSKPHQLPSSVSSIHQPQNIFTNNFNQNLNPNQNPNQNQGDLLSKFATNPVIEQQLRQLANRFGFDTNKVPDSGTMDVIKRIFGNKLFGNLPMNFASGVETKPPQQLPNLPEGIKPIKPVNVDSQVGI
uniref:MAM domain-containing protein n=1 Tax=Panagrolaimus sp. JU765 TaxID=591449 RepID=A0AC34PZD7_9BILA